MELTETELDELIRNRGNSPVSVVEKDVTSTSINGKDLTYLSFHKCRFPEAVLTPARMQSTSFNDCEFDGTTWECADAGYVGFHQLASPNGKRVVFRHLKHIRIAYTPLFPILFENCSFRGLDTLWLSKWEFSSCRFDDASFNRCLLRGAKFIACEGLWGAHRARHISESGSDVPDSDGVEEAIFCRHPWDPGWDRIRTMGSLHLFGISWFAVIAISLYASVLHWYNSQVTHLQQFTSEPHIIEHLHPLPSSKMLMMLLASSFLLGIASIIYSFKAPKFIQEFPLLRWTHELGNGEIDYRAASYVEPAWRWICAVLYAVGGSMSAIYVIWKLGKAFIWLWEAL